MRDLYEYQNPDDEARDRIHTEWLERQAKSGGDDWFIKRAFANLAYAHTPEAQEARERWLKWKNKNDIRKKKEDIAGKVLPADRKKLQNFFISLRDNLDIVEFKCWVDVGLKCYPDWEKMPDFVWRVSVGPDALETAQLYHSYLKNEWPLD